MDRIRIGYPAGCRILAIFSDQDWITIFIFEKNDSGQDQDICLISITIFPESDSRCHKWWWQGCGVGVEESESEGFLTWGVGVAENFNDSDSGQTFCSPTVTVCATNVRKRHTWPFKQLDASTRDDPGYSDRRQRTNLLTFTQGPFQISSVPWAHQATYTLWMQPFGGCITEISICSFWLALSLLRNVGYATMNESSHGNSSVVT